MAKDKVKDKDFANMEKVQSNYRKYVTKDFHFYLSYGARVALIFVAVFLLGVLSYYCFKQSFSKESKESLNYQIDKDVKYNVVLFDNPLGIKNDENTNSNLSELVNDISNDFHYEYTTEKPVDVNYSYDFEVKMVLEDKNTKEVFYTNTYMIEGNLAQHDALEWEKVKANQEERDKKANAKEKPSKYHPKLRLFETASKSSILELQTNLGKNGMLLGQFSEVDGLSNAAKTAYSDITVLLRKGWD
ncbi:MAG: hypothetical protein II625_09220, partial [Bacilli bacterium]|nr:hypothetical protein [Bacilli bacterium]